MTKISFHAFDEANNLPQPRWQEIIDQIDALPESEQDHAWIECIRQWLNALAEALGPDASIVRCDDLFCISSCNGDQAEILTPWIAHALDRIIARVGEHRTSEMRGPRVVILLSDTERYYDYIDHYYQDDGEYGASGGVCIQQGYYHIVCGPGDFSTRQLILAHELTHLALAPLTIPLWLDEGLAQIMEERITGTSYFHLDREIRQRHIAFWSESSLQPFWSGEAFGRPGETQELSYHLAEVLTRNLLADHSHLLANLLAKVHWSDAGDAACRAVLGTSLASIASEFLGNGDWSPRNIDEAPKIALTP